MNLDMGVKITQKKMFIITINTYTILKLVIRVYSIGENSSNVSFQ